MSDPSPLPPVHLRPEAELARDALVAPLLAGAARLARWARPGTAVTADGALTPAQVPAAAARLGHGTAPGGAGDAGRAGESGGAGHSAESAAAVAHAWRIAVGTGLVTLSDDPPGTVAAGQDLARLASASPGEVLDLWLTALDTALGAAVDLPRESGNGTDGSAHGTPSAVPARPGAGASRTGPGARAAEAEFLDAVLASLYALSADTGTPGDPAGAAAAVPLPALAASVIVPDGMTEPTDEVLEQVSGAMDRLDPQFRLLAETGLVDFAPVDAALLAADDTTATGGAVSAQDVSRYGMVRLTPLGRFGLRARLRQAGYETPVVGALADKDAAALLGTTANYPQAAAEEETQQWLARRTPLDGARELLAAARGGDDGAPLRRLRCQQALSLVGPAAEPALREVLDDAELGGLARVWLTEQGAPDVPPPTEKMVFWLTVDTLAAQLAAEGDSAELQALVADLERQHSGFFATAWQVDHPGAAGVLEAIGRLHGDKRIAKEARKAAFKARSRQDG